MRTFVIQVRLVDGEVLFVSTGNVPEAVTIMFHCYADTIERITVVEDRKAAEIGYEVPLG